MNDKNAQDDTIELDKVLPLERLAEIKQRCKDAEFGYCKVTYIEYYKDVTALLQEMNSIKATHKRIIDKEADMNDDLRSQNSALQSQVKELLKLTESEDE